ncbi:Arc family DNA-binding protein [Paracoccus beibuensis]|uniref:Arc family DNA-binding protein n=1 Tax=Paracoccus beibuensis TaxID=547602 RepID=UPI00389943D5
MVTVGRGAEQYTVRLPDGLRDRIKAAADAKGRSMNSEIVATLQEKYPALEDIDRDMRRIEAAVRAAASSRGPLDRARRSKVAQEVLAGLLNKISRPPE